MLNRQVLTLNKPSTRPKMKLVEASKNSLKKQAYKYCAEIVRKLKPFKQNKPLMIGIYEQILEQHPEIKRDVLAYFIKAWTHNPKYLKRLAKETHRYDLKGEPIQPISPKDKAHAEQLLKELNHEHGKP